MDTFIGNTGNGLVKDVAGKFSWTCKSCAGESAEYFIEILTFQNYKIAYLLLFSRITHG